MAWQLTFGSSSESKWHQSSDDAKHFNGELNINFASVGIGSQQFENFAARDHNLLLLRTREIAVHGMSDAGSSLECQVIQVHLRCSSMRQLVTLVC